MTDQSLSLAAKIYVVWAALAVVFAILVAGLNAETVTRLLTIAFLVLQIVARKRLAACGRFLSPRWRFVLLGTVLASVVEGFHMISKPVFDSVRINAQMPLSQALGFYAIDLLFTVPAYLVILTVIWRLITRYKLSLWEYIFLVALAQTLGDGGIFYFASAPFMLPFLPYPMTNYHAMNIIPYLAVREELAPTERSFRTPLTLIVHIIATYLVCGSLIKIAARPFGFE
ncbi:MAG TPA: hypothetical protein PKO06_11515 [Candidatus Ozemobacteraceae bacterium]|nr:hypothetical protein [Candidatus Ozemobacteraceae bacterium]